MSAADNMVKTVCEQCNGRGHVQGLQMRQCYTCESRGFVWSRVWTQEDAEAQREWRRAHMPHQFDDGSDKLQATR